jgi:class 3 adenylate cyclase
MTTRRLAAILAADVVGFSSMMERDEEATLRATFRPGTSVWAA